jgi:hypothetical protein
MVDAERAKRLREVHEGALRSIQALTDPEEWRRTLNDFQQSLEQVLGVEPYARYQKLLELSVEEVLTRG